MGAITFTGAPLRKDTLTFVLMMIIAVVQRGEPMSDMIDRQAAIDAMRKCQTYRFSATEPRMIMLAAAEEVIEELPSAQPEPKWIPCSERLPEE